MKNFISFIAIAVLAGGVAVLAAETLAQETSTTANIQYPVAELNNCQDKAACKAYCDEPENMATCLDFAEKNDLMAKEEIAAAKKFAAISDKKPGGCATKESCEEYCNEISHIDECVAFAEENDLALKEDLTQAKQVQAAIKKGIKPPACGNKKACDTYCDSPEHMEECISFGEAAGFIQGKELEDAKKTLAAIKKGVTPPPCRGKEACDEYCSSPDNMETCATFAMEAGFMSPQEMENTQKMLTAIKKGVKPPACKGQEECDTYCQQEEHFEECLNFSEAAGFMTAEEAAVSRKTGGKGPGGCKNKEECDAFCNNPDNQEICFNFGRENGLIPEEDLQRMEENKQQMKQGLGQAPQEVLDCLNSLVGNDMVEKMRSGDFLPSQKVGDAMKECFEKMGPMPGQEGQGGPGSGGNMMPAGQTGPGGCKTPEECQAYCKEHMEECQNFGPAMPQGMGASGGGQGGPGLQMMQQGAPAQGQMPAGPGGCKTPEECQSYCISNPQECQSFQTAPPVPGTGGGGGMGAPNEQPGEFIQIQPVCQGAEECQKMRQQTEQQVQNQVQQQMQNQMAPPQPCQGENCNYGPPPTTGQPGGQQPYQMQQAPAGQGIPSPTQPMPQAPVGNQQPMPQAPPAVQQPLNENPPAPMPEPNSQPSSFFAPETFLGSVIAIFNRTSKTGK
ncbi:MAG: hypothetical protein PHU56_01485 [Candidatus Pacebacteria bacterium]|nr:hypothetical protein [Candidatus Paceibacterota bacterium]